MWSLLPTLLLAVSSTVVGTSVQDHEAERGSLMQAEWSFRQDAPFRRDLSEACIKAERIVQGIRRHEIKTVWNGSLHKDDRFPGEMFPLARDKITKTKLWKIIRHMPKGSLLHGHLKQMGSFEFLFDKIMDTEGMFFYASENLNHPDGRKNAKIEFCHRKCEHPTKPRGYGCKLVHCSTSKDSVPVKAAAHHYFGGNQKAFREYVLDRLMIQSNESIRHDLGVDNIWHRFNDAVKAGETLLSYEPIVRSYYQYLFKELAQDRINWVEFRAGGSKCDLVRENDEYPDENSTAWWVVMDEELNKFKEEEAKEGRTFGARVIWSNFRGIEKPKDRTEKMDTALEMKAAFSHLISGYDLVGQEDPGYTLGELLPELLYFQKKAAENDLVMPFFFHAGETLGDGNATDSNLFDAFLLHSRRIGHGFSLYKHPLLMERFKQNYTLLEVCPISHEVLRLTTDMLHHPLPALIANGVPVAISNDDPAVLGQETPGLSFDFYQTIQAFDNVGLAGLGAMALNSVRWSNFEDQSHEDWIRDIRLDRDGYGTKAAKLNAWREQWENFCHDIVRTEGELNDVMRLEL